MAKMPAIFDELNAKLMTEEVGYKRWRLTIDGNHYQLGLSRRVEGWKWHPMDDAGQALHSFPIKLHDFGDAMSAHFNKHANV